MAGFILGLVLIIIGIAVGVALKLGTSKKPFNAIISVVLILVGIGIASTSFITRVDTGYTGVVTTFGRVENYTYDAGIHIKAPWTSVIKMDNRVQKASFNMSCFSSDIQEVSARYTLNYQISKTNAQELYKTVGVNYVDTVIAPVVQESVKTVMAHYTAENLIGNRSELAENIEDYLIKQLVKYNIEVVSTAIEDMDFTDAFTQAVEAKQVAAQNKLKAETEQAQLTMEAEQAAARAKIEAEANAVVAKTKASADAEVAKIAAEADLEVQKINADAAEYTGQKEAAKNKAINESLTPELLAYYRISQWNGEFPNTYIGSENVETILGIDTIAK